MLGFFCFCFFSNFPYFESRIKKIKPKLHLKKLTFKFKKSQICKTLPDDEPLPHVLELMKTDSKSERGGGHCTVSLNHYKTLKKSLSNKLLIFFLC